MQFKPSVLAPTDNTTCRGTTSCLLASSVSHRQHGTKEANLGAVIDLRVLNSWVKILLRLICHTWNTTCSPSLPFNIWIRTGWSSLPLRLSYTSMNQCGYAFHPTRKSTISFHLETHFGSTLWLNYLSVIHSFLFCCMVSGIFWWLSERGRWGRLIGGSDDIAV